MGFIALRGALGLIWLALFVFLSPVVGATRISYWFICGAVLVFAFCVGLSLISWWFIWGAVLPSELAFP
jgi:hypothetical protein